MARARNIKPGLFSNDLLAECDIYARFLFAGLWTIADRAGRLEDRPKKIKAEVLPYDNCDADELLNQLAKHGFIVRYSVNNIKYIQVVNFDKHQNPHKNEAESSIPSAEQHSTSTVQAPEQHNTNPADSLLLIPSSLIPDSSKKTHTNADAREPVTNRNRLKLEDLSYNDIEPWINQQSVTGNPITVDVRAELERFKTHFLSYGGKDKNGNAISDWVAKFGSWILNEQKQQKYGGKSEKDRGNNQIAGSGGASITERTVSAVDAIIAAKTARHLAKQQGAENP